MVGGRQWHGRDRLTRNARKPLTATKWGMAMPTKKKIVELTMSVFCYAADAVSLARSLRYQKAGTGWYYSKDVPMTGICIQIDDGEDTDSIKDIRQELAAQDIDG